MAFVGRSFEPFTLKNMAKMSIAVRANDFDPLHAVGSIYITLHSTLHIVIKCGPPTTCFSEDEGVRDENRKRETNKEHLNWICASLCTRYFRIQRTRTSLPSDSACRIRLRNQHRVTKKSEAPLPARSVPFSRNTWYCAGVSFNFHSSSDNPVMHTKKFKYEWQRGAESFLGNPKNRLLTFIMFVYLVYKNFVSDFPLSFYCNSL